MWDRVHRSYKGNGLMSNARLEQWEKQKAALDERIRAAKAREKERERKADNKRKFLLGAMLVEWMEQDESLKKTAMTRMKTFLTRASDRRYFGMAPLARKNAKTDVSLEGNEMSEESETTAA